MLTEKIKDKLKFLQLSILINEHDQYLNEAKKKKMSPEDFLDYLINKIYEEKARKAKDGRLSRAKIPERYVMETFPFERQPKLNKRKVLEVYNSTDYIKEFSNIIWIGPTGVGKSGLATSFLVDIINKGHTGRFVKFVDLVDELYRSIADNSSKDVLRRYQNYECLLIDEIGYVEMETTQVGLFFKLMQDRHRKKITFITTNLGFSEWVGFLKNEQLTAALVDRLTEKSYIFNMKGCKSLRADPINATETGE